MAETPQLPATRKSSQAYAAFVESLGGEYPLEPAGESRQPPLERLIRQYTQSTVWVYIAVNRIANATAQIPFQLIDPANPGAYLTSEISGLRQLLANPNPYMSRFDFVEHVYVSLELTGNAYVELAMQDRAGRAREMYPIAPERVEIVPDPKKGVKYYEFTINGKTIRFAPEQIMHIKYANPLSDVYGMSPLTAAQLSIETDLGALEWNRTFLKKGGWPTGALSTEVDLDKHQMRRLRADLKASVNRGAKSAGQFLILTNGLGFEKIALTPKEMDWLDARRLARDEILAIYGVPFAVAGLFSTEQTTARSAGVVQQVKNFYLFTVFPKIEKLVQGLNRKVVPFFRKNAACVADLRSVPALQDDVEKQLTLSQTYSTLVAAGWPPNDALRELYPHVKSFAHGDVAWLNQATIPVKGPKNDYQPTVQEQQQAAKVQAQAAAAAAAAKPKPGKPNTPAKPKKPRTTPTDSETQAGKLLQLGFDAEQVESMLRVMRHHGVAVNGHS